MKATSKWAAGAIVGLAAIAGLAGIASTSGYLKAAESKKLTVGGLTMDYWPQSGEESAYLSGAAEKDPVIHITEAGEYVLSGVLNGGKVVADAKGEDAGMEIVLNGVSLSSQTGPAIEASGKNVTLAVKKGTENSVSSATEYAVKVTGGGTAEIEGGGFLSISGDGIATDGNISVSEAAIAQSGGDSAIDASGKAEILSGTFVFEGGIDAGNGIFTNGGVVSAGGGAAAEGSKQNSITLSFKEPVGGIVTVTSTDKKPIMAVDVGDGADSLLLSAPGMKKDGVYVYTSSDVEGEKDRTGVYSGITSFKGALMQPASGKGAAFTPAQAGSPETAEGYTGSFSMAAVEITADYGYTAESVTKELVITNPENHAVKEIHADSGDFTVKAEDGKYYVVPKEGLSAGSYNGTVTATFTGEDDGDFTATASITFTVNKAKNSWKKRPYIADFAQYESNAAPTGEAAFGTVTFTYAASEEGGYKDEAPTTPGLYWMKAHVDGNENYEELEETSSFTIFEHTSHLYVEKVTGDCEEGVTVQYTCSYCKASSTIKREAAPHAYDRGKTEKKASCTVDGSIKYTCTVCGDSYTESIPATGHNYGAGTVTKDADCEESGIRTYTCSSCGNTFTQEIPSLGGHAWDAGKVEKEATCTSDGVTLYTCRNNPRHTYTEKIKSLGHSWDEGKVTKEATCTENGVKTYTCKNDGSHTYTEDIPLLGHDYDDGIITEKATCEEEGVKTFTCKNDKSHTYTKKIKATGHKWDGGKVTKDATCNAVGIKTYTCLNDHSHTYTEEIARLNHDWGKGKVTTKPTCGKEGVRTYTCVAGGESKTESIPATGEHTWGEPMEMDDGNSKMYVCSTCGETKQEAAEQAGESGDNGEAEESKAAAQEKNGGKKPMVHEQDDKNESNGAINRIQVMLLLVYAAVFAGAVGIVFFIYKRQKKGY